jgi:energy-coupling factor transport system ATP-binding protein
MSLKVQNLTFYYSEKGPWNAKILDNISFTLEPGEILGITGAPGSGKSTLLQLLNGILPAKEKQIFIDEQDINELKGKKNQILRRKVALVAQFPEKQLFARTVFEDIAFGPSNWGIQDEELKIRVQEAMEMVGLDFELFKDRRPLGLSGGEKRKVALAGILSIRPQYLLLDEPTAGMDNEARETLFANLNKIKERHNTGIIIVSHRPQDLLVNADRVMILEKGQSLVCSDTITALMKLEEKVGGLTPSRELLYRLQAKGLSVDFKARNPEQVAREIFMALGGEKQDV